MFGGKIGALFGRKAGISGLLPAPRKTLSIPQNVSYGDFFRTRAFIHPETGPDFVMWYQATREPFGNKWLVQEIWQHPNTVSSAESLLEESKTLNSGQAVSFEEALRTLGRYEFTQPKMEYIPHGPSAEELGDEHVNAFALHNGIAFDVHGVPYMSHRGRILDDGCFLPETKTAVLDLYRQGVTVQMPWNRASLARTLDCKSILVSNPSGLLALKEDFIRWKKFIYELGSLLKYMVLDQDLNRVNRRSVKDVRKRLADLQCLSAADKVEIYEPFLSYLELVQEVAAAKTVFCFLHKEDKYTDDYLQKLTDNVVRLCREQGGSTQDIACLKAEILNKESFILNDKESMKPLLGIIHPSESHCVRYFPDVIPEFMAALPKMTAELERQIAAEEARIIKPLDQFPAPTLGGGL